MTPGSQPAVCDARAWALRDNITTYAAIYVALAEQLGAVLVTADLRLASAVQRFASCEVVLTTTQK